MLYLRLLTHARMFMGTWTTDMAAGLAAPDGVTALRLAHDLQAIAVRIGARPLAESASALDAALRFGDVEGIQAAREQTSQRIQEALRSPWLATPEESAAQNAGVDALAR